MVAKPAELLTDVAKKERCWEICFIYFLVETLKMYIPGESENRQKRGIVLNLLI